MLLSIQKRLKTQGRGKLEIEWQIQLQSHKTFIQSRSVTVSMPRIPFPTVVFHQATAHAHCRTDTLVLWGASPVLQNVTSTISLWALWLSSEKDLHGNFHKALGLPMLQVVRELLWMTRLYTTTVAKIIHFHTSFSRYFSSIRVSSSLEIFQTGQCLEQPDLMLKSALLWTMGWDGLHDP